MTARAGWLTGSSAVSRSRRNRLRSLRSLRAPPRCLNDALVVLRETTAATDALTGLSVRPGFGPRRPLDTSAPGDGHTTSLRSTAGERGCGERFVGSWWLLARVGWVGGRTLGALSLPAVRALGRSTPPSARGRTYRKLR